MRHRRQISSYRNLYLTVLLVSLVAILLPSAWTGKLVSLVQILVPFQHAASAGADLLHPLDDGASAAVTVSAVEHAEVQRERDAMQHQAAALAARVRQLEGEVEILTATRLWDVGGRGIGPVGRLIPTQVVTKDLLSWRESRLVTAGTLQGVKAGAAVISSRFTVDHRGDTQIRQGMAVLLKETLIGVIHDTLGTHTSRIQLLSDPDVEMKVRIGRLTDGEFTLLEPYFWLTGRGSGVMQIGDIDCRDVEGGKIRVGDLVFSDPMSDTLPAALTIGRISRIDQDVESPLLSTLTVESPIDITQLRRVYVFDPDTDSQE